MKLSASRKSQPSATHREGSHFTQQISEIVRSILSRSEDASLLSSISDRSTGKLKCATVFAEKLISDSELKEDWRIAREDSVMISVGSLNAESAGQKR